MAGVIAAPRDGLSVAGVAWGSNLLSVRQSDGVANVSSGDAKQSVRIAAQGGAQVIVMGWQSMNWWWQVSDEIKYWHRNRPILFVAAAGTSGCGDGILDSNVVFPADMGEVVAVTGAALPRRRHPLRHPLRQAGGADRLPGRAHHGPARGGGGGDRRELQRHRRRRRDRRADLVAQPGDDARPAAAAALESGALYPNRNGSRGYGLVDARKAVAGS
jgi:hypothetical protein